MIKNFGRKNGGEDIFEMFGINQKFTDLQAVVGIEQMNKLDSRIEKYRQIWEWYYSHLQEIPNINIILLILHSYGV